MVDQRYEDTADFDKQDVGDRLQRPNGVVEVGGAIKCLGVCIKMFQ